MGRLSCAGGLPIRIASACSYGARCTWPRGNQGAGLGETSQFHRAIKSPRAASEVDGDARSSRTGEWFGTARRAPPFANFAMFQMDLHAIPFGHPYGLVVPQADVEQVLETRAEELGAEIRRAHEVVDVHQEDDHVKAGIADQTAPTCMRRVSV
jgi:2-polyprenyl-6-methoxyphenol hydroxylase-like FAD-dependent oxidoreductase